MCIGVLLGLDSACECRPSVNSFVRGPMDTVISMAVFSFGAILISLTQYGHVHEN